MSSLSRKNDGRGSVKTSTRKRACTERELGVPPSDNGIYGTYRLSYVVWTARDYFRATGERGGEKCADLGHCHAATRRHCAGAHQPRFDFPPMAVRSTAVGTAVFEDGILTGVRIDRD